MGMGSAANTHQLHGTVWHQHLDGLVYWATGDFPDAGLNLVECSDGRWFVEVDHGSLFDEVDGISKPDISPYIEPRFFNSETDARTFACDCLRVKHPALEGKDLSLFFDDED